MAVSDVAQLEAVIERQTSAYETEARNYDDRLRDLNERFAELAGDGSESKRYRAPCAAGLTTAGKLQSSSPPRCSNRSRRCGHSSWRYALLSHGSTA